MTLLTILLNAVLSSTASPGNPSCVIHFNPSIHLALGRPLLFPSGSFSMNSTNGSQVTISNIAQKILKITLGDRIKLCKIIGCNSEYFWRCSLSNFLFWRSCPQNYSVICNRSMFYGIKQIDVCRTFRRCLPNQGTLSGQNHLGEL